jgi:hypothetical protein
MSDEQRERAEDRAEEDVEAHGFSAPVGEPIGDVEAHGFEAPHAPIGEPIGATEEPPDVEGHNMGAPISAPVSRPKDG